MPKYLQIKHLSTFYWLVQYPFKESITQIIYVATLYWCPLEHMQAIIHLLKRGHL